MEELQGFEGEQPGYRPVTRQMNYPLIIRGVSAPAQPPRTSIKPENASSDWQALTESPDSKRLLGPLWTASGLTIQEGCRLYAGSHWRAGTVTATGATFAMVRTSAGLERCSDRRNLQTKEEAEAFKSATSGFRRVLRKRQGGQDNG